MRLLLTFVISAATCLPTLSAADKSDRASEVNLPKEAVAVLAPSKGKQAHGVIVLKQHDEFVHITGEVHGLTPGKHGFHIHEFGDLRAADGSSAGGHYAPKGHKHGGPQDRKHHAGDLGNISANKEGVAVVDKKSKDFKLHFVVGRAIVVHGKADDLTSQPSGDAGPRVALGVVGFANVKNAKKKTR